jgi:serine/threonine protein kinase
MSRGVRYRVLRKLAHGGMAEIFLANQVGAEGFEKPVVLKRVLPALAADPAFVRMLVDEAHIVSSLNHSNLVQVLDLGQADGQFFLVLEFVDGFSLEQVRRRANKLRMKLPLPLALYITSSLCRALDYVHRRTRNGEPLGIVHRDVTPQNVLISREGEVKLADFGIAKAIGKREKSSTGVIKGKFAYMSPEQAVGAELDARSDLFSVGTLLYILTTGKKPFDAPTDLETLMQVRRARFEKPSALLPDFDPDVERFLARALRSERSKRFQSAEQMADRLDKMLIKLGQPTGPAALKRWLDNLSARDGVLPPGDARVAPIEQPAGTVELGSAELELLDVPSARGEDEDEPYQDISDARTELAFTTPGVSVQPLRTSARNQTRGDVPEEATVVAHAGYPERPEPEAETQAITIVVPSGATVVGLTPGDDQVRVRREGGASAPRELEPTVRARALSVEEMPPRDSLLVLDDDPAPEDAPAIDDARVDEPAAQAAPPQQRQRTRRRWGVAVTSVCSLGLLAGGLLGPWHLSKDLAPEGLVELVEQCRAQVQRLPRALRERAARLASMYDEGSTEE